jgi:hypothetical protein
MLALNQQPVVQADDFYKPDDRALWRFLRGKIATWSVASEGDLGDSLEDELLRDRVQTLLALPQEPESGIDRFPETLTLSVLDWRQEHTKGSIVEVQHLYSDEDVSNERQRKELYGQRLRELTEQLREINQARAAMTITGRRRTKEAASNA